MWIVTTDNSYYIIQGVIKKIGPVFQLVTVLMIKFLTKIIFKSRKRFHGVME